MKHRIVEIFISLQGEGFWTGTRAIFVRFLGCNRVCDFGNGFKCDEPLHKGPNYTEYSTEELVKKLKEIKAAEDINFVVITGGEPSLNNLNPLLRRLNSELFYTQVETNGYNLANIEEAGFITISPKEAFGPGGEPPVKSSREPDEVKFLGGVNIDMDEALAYSYIKHKYIQPISFSDKLELQNIHACYEWVMKHNNWRLSLQTHKIYGAR